MFVTSLAITVYIACAKPQYVRVEKDNREVWLRVVNLQDSNTPYAPLKFKVEGSKEDVDFHNAVLEELVKNNQNVNIYINKDQCYKI
jgi:hypothetical protein